MSFPPHQRIADAIRTTEHETEILSSERTAYRQFVIRLDDIDHGNARSGTVAGAPGMHAAVEPTSVAEPLRTARDAYRETIMATPHYDAEYGETLGEHLAAEFGDTVATQLVDGRALTPVLRQSLRGGSTEAIRQRTELLKSLASEQRSLRRCDDTVVDVQTRLNEIHARLSEQSDAAMRCAIDDQLATLESECETLLTRRQRQINNRSGIFLSGDATSLARYLYDDLDGVHPILSAVTECLETIRTCRIRCLR